MNRYGYYGMWLMLTVCLASTVCKARAQAAADYTTWLKVGVQHDVGKRLGLSGGLEWRTKDHVGLTDRLGLDIAAQYEALSFLKVGVGYEVHYRNRGGGRMEVPLPISCRRNAFGQMDSDEVCLT